MFEPRYLITLYLARGTALLHQAESMSVVSCRWTGEHPFKPLTYRAHLTYAWQGTHRSSWNSAYLLNSALHNRLR